MALFLFKDNIIYPEEGNMLQQERTKMEIKNRKILQEV